MSDDFCWNTFIAPHLVHGALNVASAATWEGVGARPIRDILTPGRRLDSAKAIWNSVRSFRGNDGKTYQNAIVSQLCAMGGALFLKFAFKLTEPKNGNQAGSLIILSTALLAKWGAPSPQGQLWMVETSKGNIKHDPGAPRPFTIGQTARQR